MGIMTMSPFINLAVKRKKRKGEVGGRCGDKARCFQGATA